ncbi:hypothetical protein ACA758_02255 [Mycoplasmopsis agassizii]|uniref:hypothetical protein n=1 Tax=Mycoplasmopsis agassizii TaxID=33922 RepID=UPI003528EFA2
MSKDKNENKILKAIKKIKALPRTLKAIRDIVSWIFKYYDADITKSEVTLPADASSITYDLQIKGNMKKPDIETIFIDGGNGKGGTDNSGIDPKIVKYIDQKNSELESRLVATMDQKNSELKNELINTMDQKNSELESRLVARMDQKIDEVRKESREQNEKLNKKIDDRFDQLLEAIKNIKK